MNDSSTSSLCPDDKLRWVLEAEALSEQELGAFLRENGLHEVELQRWKQDMLAALEPTARGACSTPTHSSKAHKATVRAQAKHIQMLKRDLNRKNKALAEAAALLVLQKKFQILWEDEDTSTPGSSAR